MGSGKLVNLKKCGEILIDLNSKNKKSKVYFFHCTLCNLNCDQLKKFSLHIGNEHLNNPDDILNKTEMAELKFEAESEEIGLQTFSDNGDNEMIPDIKMFEISAQDQINVHPDPLDTVNTRNPNVANNEIFNCAVKQESNEDYVDESNFGDTEAIDCGALTAEGELVKKKFLCETEAFDCGTSTTGKAIKEKINIAKTNTDDNSYGTDSDSEDDFKYDSLDQIPLKKRKLNFSKDVKTKIKTSTKDICSDDSKDADYTSSSVLKCVIPKIANYSLEPENKISNNNNFDMKSYIDGLFKQQSETIYKQNQKIMEALADQTLLIRSLLKQAETTTKLTNLFPITSEALLMEIEKQIQENDKYLYAETDFQTIKKHKRCKRRWRRIDQSKLPILIKIYKTYEILWQVNNIAFGILPKRNEAFDKMLEEVKVKHNFNTNLDELRNYIDYINHTFRTDKEQELKCELDKTEFKPTSNYYQELSFLSDSQGPFKCPNCNEIIKKYDRFHIHVAQHNGSIPFQCRLCEMGFQKMDSYLLHTTRHLGINSYHCNVCGKGYPVKSELDWHLTSHTGVRPFLCPICGAGFRARHGYDNHIRRHEKRFRYECHICKHGFNHLCKLNTHIKSHLNIRDVICNVCGKGFTAAKYLHRHKLIHETEKRYKCNVCGKAFAQDSGLRTHRKQHKPNAMISIIK